MQNYSDRESSLEDPDALQLKEAVFFAHSGCIHTAKLVLTNQVGDVGRLALGQNLVKACQLTHVEAFTQPVLLIYGKWKWQRNVYIYKYTQFCFLYLSDQEHLQSVPQKAQE